MPKFRKKPVVTDAVQWNGKNFDEVMNFMGENHGTKIAYEATEELALKTGEILFRTIHGEIAIARPGDWIIPEMDRADRFYPCKPDIFEQTYEPVDEITTSP